MNILSIFVIPFSISIELLVFFLIITVLFCHDSTKDLHFRCESILFFTIDTCIMIHIISVQIHYHGGIDSFPFIFMPASRKIKTPKIRLLFMI